MTTIDLVYFDAGGGHRAAAAALEAAIQRSGRAWQVRKVHLFDVLDRGGRFRRLTGIAPEDLYNKRLARGWTAGMATELKLLQGLIHVGHRSLVELLQGHWQATRPDLVVSLIPNFNRALCESAARALPGVPYVTVLTDMADHPPSFWIERGQQQHFVCGTRRAVEQARAAGHAEGCIHPTSGMLLHPDFYAESPLARPAAREALGLDPTRTTAVVTFGGQGSSVMIAIARQLADVQAIFLCGRNRVLAERLRRMPSVAPRAVVEFTPRVCDFMRLGDFFVGKPGPGSLSEAVCAGLPVVTVLNRWTMPQERYNAAWVRERGVGLVGEGFGRIRPTVDTLLARLPDFQQAVQAIDNRAVFELPEILERVFQGAAAPRPWPAAASRNDRPTAAAAAH